MAKGGSSPLSAVYEYAEKVMAKGFVFMDTPGYDPVSVTGMVAGGANVVCFTTGRGSVFGSKPAPCLKLATNSEVYRRMAEDMDVNCGAIVDGTLSVDDVGREIFDLVLAVASGQRTKSEELGFGDEEFTPGSSAPCSKAEAGPVTWGRLPGACYLGPVTWGLLPGAGAGGRHRGRRRCQPAW